MISKAINALRWLMRKCKTVNAISLVIAVLMLCALHFNLLGLLDYTRTLAQGNLGPLLVAFAVMDLLLWSLIEILRGLLWLVRRSEPKDVV